MRNDAALQPPISRATRLHRREMRQPTMISSGVKKRVRLGVRAEIAALADQQIDVGEKYRRRCGCTRAESLRIHRIGDDDKDGQCHHDQQGQRWGKAMKAARVESSEIDTPITLDLRHQHPRDHKA